MSAGWFPDPDNPSLVRYWDGTAWTQHTSVAPSSAPPQASAPPYPPAPPQYATPGYPPPAYPPQAYPPQAYPAASPPKKSSKWWIAPVAVVVIVGLAIGGWFVAQALSGPATLDDIENVLERKDVTCQAGEGEGRSDFLERNSADDLPDEAQRWADAAVKAIKAEPDAKKIRLYYCWEDGVDTNDPDELAHSYTDILTVIESGKDDRPVLVSISTDNDFEDDVKDLDVKVLVDPATIDWVTDEFIESLDEGGSDGG